MSPGEQITGPSSPWPWAERHTFGQGLLMFGTWLGKENFYSRTPRRRMMGLSGGMDGDNDPGMCYKSPAGN